MTTLRDYLGNRLDGLDEVIGAHISLVRDFGKRGKRRDPQKSWLVCGPIGRRSVHRILDEIGKGSLETLG